MVDRSQLQRMIDRMDEALSIMERGQAARHDAEDEEVAEGHTFPVAPSSPFADSQLEKIHGEGREDQDFWGPPKPKLLIPIEHI
jgi:hypothetical protein